MPGGGCSSRRTRASQGTARPSSVGEQLQLARCRGGITHFHYSLANTPTCRAAECVCPARFPEGFLHTFSPKTTMATRRSQSSTRQAAPRGHSRNPCAQGCHLAGDRSPCAAVSLQPQFPPRVLLLFFSTCFPTLPHKLCSAWSRSGFDISMEPFGFILVSPLSLLAQPAHLTPCTSRAALPCSPHLSPPTLQALCPPLSQEPPTHTVLSCPPRTLHAAHLPHQLENQARKPQS